VPTIFFKHSLLSAISIFLFRTKFCIYVQWNSFKPDPLRTRQNVSFRGNPVERGYYKGVKVDFGPLAMLSTIYRVQLRGVLLFIFFSLYFVSNKDLFP